MEEFFIKTMKYLKDNKYEFKGMAFIKPMLVNYSSIVFLIMNYYFAVNRDSLYFLN